MGNVTKQASTRFSIVKRSKGQSAVEKASYISRSVLVSEFDGQTYRPKYHEDLVHIEITLPPNAPKEYADRATLWNSVELSEKGQKSQLARMLKASLPNEWRYELAEEVVRDYVQRNFVDKGMCADWAIHDSENDKGQRNFHIHVLLTMRPIKCTFIKNIDGSSDMKLELGKKGTLNGYREYLIGGGYGKNVGYGEITIYCKGKVSLTYNEAFAISATEFCLNSDKYRLC